MLKIQILLLLIVILGLTSIHSVFADENNDNTSESNNSNDDHNDNHQDEEESSTSTNTRPNSYIGGYKPTFANHYNKTFSPFSLNGNNFTLEHYTNQYPTQIAQIGKPINMQLNVFQNSFYAKIKDIVIFIGTNADSPYLQYDSELGIIKHDPRNVLSNLSIEKKENGEFTTIKLQMTFKKEMGMNDIKIRVWNDHLWSIDTQMPNMINVIK